MHRRWGCHSSFCSSINPPTKRVMAGALGKMPTMSVRRLISALTLSSGLVPWICVRCVLGKVMNASTSGAARSISSESLGNLGSQLVRYDTPKCAGCVEGLLHEDGVDGGEYDLSLSLAGVREGMAHEVSPERFGFAALHIGRIDPQVRPVALQRTVEERMDPLVDVAAQPADLALGDPAHAHGLDELIHRAHRDALDIGLLHHGGEGFLSRATRLEERRDVAPLAQLGIFTGMDPARVSHSRSR